MKKLGFLVGAASISLLASQAMAVFNPPVGDIKFKLTDASNVYDPTTLAPRGRVPFPPGAIFQGDVDFTAFRLTSFTLNGSDQDQSIPGTLTGVVTFLEVDSLVNAPPVLVAGIGDDQSRPHTTAGVDPITGRQTIGRFFLFDNPLASAGDAAGIGGRPQDVDFSTGLLDNPVTSNGIDVFTIDHLPNFTSGTLLATGSLIPDPNGEIPDVLIQSFINGVAATGSIGTHELLLDGGLWFDQGLFQGNRGSFQINQIAYSGTVTDFDDFTSPQGDQNVFEGGWQISSEDPLQFRVGNPIPEPVTAGLGSVALLAIAGYVTGRRKA